MAKISKFDPATCRMISERITKALASLAEELGVSIAVRGGSYSDHAYTPKLEVSTVSADGTVQTKAADAFKILAKVYGMSPDDLGRTFRMNGREYKITGLATRKRTRPVLASHNGKEYCFAAEDVKLLMVKS